MTRESRLNAPRTINDPDHGVIGIIRRVEAIPGTSKGLRWYADSKDGAALGSHKTAKLAIAALCERYAHAVSGIDEKACERLNNALRHAWGLK